MHVYYSSSGLHLHAVQCQVYLRLSFPVSKKKKMMKKKKPKRTKKLEETFVGEPK